MCVKGTDTKQGRRWGNNIFLSAEKLLWKLPAPSLLSYLHKIVALFTHLGRSDISSKHKMLNADPGLEDAHLEFFLLRSENCVKGLLFSVQICDYTESKLKVITDRTGGEWNKSLSTFQMVSIKCRYMGMRVWPVIVQWVGYVRYSWGIDQCGIHEVIGTRVVLCHWLPK